MSTDHRVGVNVTCRCVSCNARNLAAEINVGAYLAGYAIGFDVRTGASKRHVVDPATHEHWRKGFDDGRAAAINLADAYRVVARRHLSRWCGCPADVQCPCGTAPF